MASFLVPIETAGQNWAGPDQSVCGSSEGVFIGLEGADPQNCYKWSPTTNLEGDPCQARVLVKPEETTTYSVTVTGPNFSFTQVDEVVVDVDFGNIQFTPGFTEPDSMSNQSTAMVANNPGNHPHQWLIVEPLAQRLGCSIDPTTGVISGCKEAGEITVRAQRTDFPVCKAEATFRVNTGVRDVEARDLSTANGNRVAKTGETLVLVDRNPVEFKALPNDNEQFGLNDITWTGPGAPSNGAPLWENFDIFPQSFTVSANDKSVNVERKNTISITVPSPNFALFSLLQSGLEKFKPTRPWNQVPGAGTCSPFTPTALNTSDSYIQNNTNKYNSPEEGTKHTLSTSAAFEATGRMCFPPPYSSLPNPFGYYYTYAFLTGSLGGTISGSKDEGAADTTWNMNTVTVTGAFTAGIGADFGISVPGDIFVIAGSVTGSATLSTTLRYVSPNIEGQVKLEPLVVSGSLSAWITSPNDPIIGVSGRYNIMDPYVSDWVSIMTF